MRTGIVIPGWVWLALALVATAVAQWPVLRVYFFADDFVWLFRFATEPPLRALFSVFGGHAFLLRNVVFLGMYELWGARPEPYQWLALATHLVNVALLFMLLRSLTDSSRLAGLGATIWGTSPLCTGSLAWYCVYGHVMVGTLLLTVLLSAVRVREVSLGTTVAWAGLLLGSVLCFGVGVGVAGVFPLAVAGLRPDVFRQRGARVVLLALPVAVVALYAAYVRIAALIGPLDPGEYFLLSHPGRHPARILMLLGHLFAFGTFGLVFGALAPSVTDPGTVFATVAECVLLAVAVLAGGDRRTRGRFAVGLVLAMGAYAVIAVGRASFLSWGHVPPAMGARALRYHYVGALALTLCLCVVLAELGRWPRMRPLGVLVLPVWLAVAVLAWRQLPAQVESHDDGRAYVAEALRSMDAQIDRTPPGVDVLIRNPRPHGSVAGPLGRTPDFPGWAGIFAVHHADDVVRGHRIRFVEEDAKALAALRGRSPRLAELFVPAR